MRLNLPKVQAPTMQNGRTFEPILTFTKPAFALTTNSTYLWLTNMKIDYVPVPVECECT